jgi:dGTPase
MAINILTAHAHVVDSPTATMRTRQQLEHNEHLTLAPWAAKSAASRGRVYPDPESPYRTAFQRDRERVLHTTAFRRLQGKTQVFVVTEGDYYRTRITHTMEVAQIGRTIARALGANEDLVEGVCLAHDLGHPPFGHSGERVLDTLMRTHGGFDHNQRSYQIITQLERRYPEHPGLNLTYEFREGIVKHETEYDAVSAPAEYAPDKLGSIEAQIASIADELAYNCHDLDDGLRAGLLSPDDTRTLKWWHRAHAEARIDSGQAYGDMTRHRVVRRLISLMTTDLIEETSRRIAGAAPDTIDDIRAHPAVLVGFNDATRQLNAELKSFLYEKMYFHPRVIRMMKKAERVLVDLFGVYVAEPRMLPEGARRWVGELPLERVVCNYIAGMTDRFALDEHARLFDPHEKV